MENYYFNITDKTSVVFILLCLSMTVIPSCKDIIEEDISEQSVDVIIPQHNDTLTTNNVHFKWNELEGADAYRLQIVQPSFSDINTFVLDSAVEGTEYFYVLNPGEYQYQIRAENSAYEGLYTGPYTIFVDSVSDLTNNVIPLISPVDNYYTNQSNLTFSWQGIFAADNYEIQIRSGADFNNSGTILLSQPNVSTTTYTTTSSPFVTEGEYSWGVRATNANSQSNFSSRQINIDLTNPNDVSLLSPADASTSLTDTVVFKWSYGTDPGTVNSPVSYILELDTDMNFGSFTEYTSTTDSLQLILSTNTYYWRVYAQDEAGNISDLYSAEYEINVP